MLARRVNGSHPVSRLRDEMDRLFNGFLGDSPFFETFGPWGARPFPGLNMWEEDENLFVEAELPGLKMENLEVFVEGDELTVKGRRQIEEPEGATFHRRERGAEAFSRVIRLPVDINADAVEANLRDGVLTIRLPKAETARPRKIEIKNQTA